MVESQLVSKQSRVIGTGRSKLTGLLGVWKDRRQWGKMKMSSEDFEGKY
jgi:hypothetical protein